MFTVSDVLSKIGAVPATVQTVSSIFMRVGINKAAEAFRNFVSSNDLLSVCSGGWSVKKGSVAAEVARLFVSFFSGRG